MNGLFPIIRRARRPLLPPEDAVPVIPPAVVELPPSAPPVEAVVAVPEETPAAPPAEALPKKAKGRGKAPN